MNGDKYAIIADSEGKGWSFAEAVYHELHHRDTGFYLNPVTIQHFRDGELKPQITRNVRKRECYFIHDSAKDPAQWFLELCLINSALKKASAREIVDVLPYIRFGRQDRKDVPRAPISAKVVAQAVGFYGATSALTLDLHSEQAEGFFDVPSDDLKSFPVVIDHLQRYHPTMLEDMVFASTDVGGGKRITRLANKAGIEEIVIPYKTRSKAGNVESIKILGDVKGRKVFFGDDIADTCGTMTTAALEARAQGAREVYGYSTFGLFTKGIDSIIRAFDRFFVGDLLPVPNHPKIEKISFVQEFADAIYRSSQGESISEMFEINKS